MSPEDILDEYRGISNKIKMAAEDIDQSTRNLRKINEDNFDMNQVSNRNLRETAEMMDQSVSKLKGMEQIMTLNNYLLIANNPLMPEELRQKASNLAAKLFMAMENDKDIEDTNNKAFV